MATPYAKPLKLTDSDVQALEVMAKSTVLPYRAVREAKGLLLAHKEMTNTAIAKALSVSMPTVAAWRNNFEKDGIAWVGKVRSGRGRKHSIPKEKIEKMIADTQNTKPKDATHWSLRTMAKHSGLSTGTIAKEWKARGLKPHLIKTFKLSNDPNFEEKLIDVVGLYMNPPENAIVFSFDEKSQIQALDRTQPSLPMEKGKAGTMTHDYKRNGTTTLFAALNTLTGELIGKCFPKHRNDEFLSFLKMIKRETPKDQQIHIILDNYATHKHKNIKEWLEKNPRFHFHFTPTSSSWLNLVERWFRNITDKAIRRGTFDNVSELITTINDYIANNNENPKPFIWKKSAEVILEKVKRGRNALDKVQEVKAN